MMPFDESRLMADEIVDRIVSIRSQRLGEHAGKQVRNMWTYLCEKSNFLEAPASAKYHRCNKGGLMAHSIDVAVYAEQLARLLMPQLPMDSVLFCSFFHDVGKVWSSTSEDGKFVPRYAPNILKSSGQQSEAQPYHHVKGGDEICLTIKDLLVAMKFVDMSDAEMQALLLSDGQYVPVNASLGHNEHPLGLIVHWSDYWVSHVVEGNVKAEWLRGILFRP